MQTFRMTLSWILACFAARRQAFLGACVALIGTLLATLPAEPALASGRVAQSLADVSLSRPAAGFGAASSARITKVSQPQGSESQAGINAAFFADLFDAEVGRSALFAQWHLEMMLGDLNSAAHSTTPAEASVAPAFAFVLDRNPAGNRLAVFYGSPGSYSWVAGISVSTVKAGRSLQEAEGVLTVGAASAASSLASLGVEMDRDAQDWLERMQAALMGQCVSVKATTGAICAQPARMVLKVVDSSKGRFARIQQQVFDYFAGL